MSARGKTPQIHSSGTRRGDLQPQPLAPFVLMTLLKQAWLHGTTAYMWFTLSSILRYCLELSLQAFGGAFALGLLAHYLFLTTAANRAAWADWAARPLNAVRVLGVYLSTALVNIVCFLDSDLVWPKMRVYCENFTATQLWSVALWFALAIGLFTVVEDFLGRGSPLPRLFKLLFAVAVFGVIAHRLGDDYKRNSCLLEPGRAYESFDEAAVLQDGVRRLVTKAAHTTVAAYAPTPARRLVHPKAHGCVQARFVVNRDLPRRFAHGVLQPGAQYDTIVRFSNGAMSDKPDSVPDVRGMALKLLGVAGAKVLAPDEPGYEAHTQDFLLITSPVFLLDSPRAYHEFMTAIAASEQSVWPMFKFVFNSWNPLRWHLRMLLIYYRMLQHGAAVTNPLAAQYWSATPYQLGGEHAAVKYSLRPCSANSSYARASVPLTDANYLRESLRLALDPASGGPDACFEFLVQEQGNPCLNPVDNPQVVWSEPLRQVATLFIPKQKFLFRDQMAFCSRLSFSPWHSLPAHVPKGAMNAARRPAYSTSAVTRAGLNGGATFEPTGDEFAGFAASPELASPYLGGGRVTDWQHAHYPAPYAMLPSLVASFPSGQDFSAAKLERMAVWGISINVNVFEQSLGTCEKPFAAFATPDDYRFLLHNPLGRVFDVPPPTVTARWTSDAEFGRQFLAGTNPMSLRACTGALPPGLNLTAEHVAYIDKTILTERDGAGAGLKQLLASGRLFYADYEVLLDIETFKNRVVYAPLVLLYRAGTGASARLLPLAIQLERLASGNRVFLPHALSAAVRACADMSAAERVWLFAKMHAASADAQVHEMVFHLGYTHLALEPLIIAAQRQLPPEHGLLALLEPHFHDTIAINSMGRNSLLRPRDSVFDRITAVGLAGALQLMEKTYRRDWSLPGFAFPTELAARGFNRTEPLAPSDNLPNFLYRDYGYLLWDALFAYTTEVVARIYASDAAVAADGALRALMAELRDPFQANVPGPVADLTTRQQVAHFATTLIFTAAVQHSVVNNGQFEFYAFLPNRPLYLLSPMPEDTRLLDWPYVMAALPPLGDSQEMITMTRLLSLAEAVAVVDLSEHSAPPRPAQYAAEWARLQVALRAAEAKMNQRNAAIVAAGGVACDLLLPSKLAASISI